MTDAVQVLLPKEITPAEMIQLALDKGADVDQLERLIALKERWEATEARKAFVSAMAAFAAEAPQLQKNKKAAFDHKSGDGKTSYQYITLDNAVAILAPLLAKHGLRHRWDTTQFEGGIVEVSCVMSHVDGHEQAGSTLRGGLDQSGTKNPIQALGSTVTYLERYTFLASTGQAAKGMDDDGLAAYEFINAEQTAAINKLIADTDTNIGAFLTFAKVGGVEEILAKNYGAAITALQQKRKSK